MTKHLFLSHLSLLKHETGEHPEKAERMEMIIEEFKKKPYDGLLNLSCTRSATIEEISQVHDIDYINHIRSLEGQVATIDSETIMSFGTVKAACLAAGLGLELVERVVKGETQNGFVVVRPPGHHARPSTGMGFCIFNNIAIAAKKALAMGIQRLVILDWDVHHGNGTQEIFYEDNRVLFVDLHQSGLFPVSSGLISETGSQNGMGYTVNIPLPVECKDQDYLYVFDQLVKPLILNYSPNLILVSAGFDAHESDPLGFMNLTTDGYRDLTKRIKSLAEEVCEGKLVLFLEGGYNTFFLAKNVLECVKVLCEEKSVNKIEEIKISSPQLEELVREIHGYHFK